MISFRYHIVSVVAVFLALAVGVVVGTTALNGPITNDLRHQVSTLTDQRNSATAQSNSLTDEVSQTDNFAQLYGAKVVNGSLANRTVLILGLPGASSTVKDALAQEVAYAGGKVTGRVQLTPTYSDPAGSGDIVSLATSVHPIGLTYPQTNDAGILGGALLSYVLVGKGTATDLSSVLSGFAALHMLVDESQTVAKADSVLVVTSGGLPQNDQGGQEQLQMVTQLQNAGGRVLVAGDAASANSHGVVALVRGDAGDKSSVSTVDNADSSLGEISAVLALSSLPNTVGHYGATGSAQSLFPEPAR